MMMEATGSSEKPQYAGTGIHGDLYLKLQP
jgi:hypothetical protein